MAGSAALPRAPVAAAARIGRELIAEQRGSVTAEFAVVLPAVLMVLVLAIGSILAATQRLALTSAVAEVARLEARGDHQSAAARLEQLGAGVSVRRDAQGALHCVVLGASPGAGLLGLIEVSARACAASSGVP